MDVLNHIILKGWMTMFRLFQWLKQPNPEDHLTV